MYTDGPRSAEFPKNEYNEHVSRIPSFLNEVHCSGSFGSSAGIGKRAWP